MGILQGKQFFSWEILPVLDAAKSAAMTVVNDALDGGPEPGDDVWAQLLITLTRLKIEANTRASNDNVDKSGSSPPLYRAGDSWWKEIDAAVSSIPIPDVMTIVNALPNDVAPPASTSIPPVMILGALAALAVGGYLWSRR